MRRQLLAGACLAAAMVCLAGVAAAAQGPDSAISGASGQVLTQVGEQFSFIWDPEVLGIVREIGDTVARAYKAPRDRYHLYIVNSPDLNAFCTPSGDIFIYAGQLMRLRSEDELAAVLAHEMAHREGDHFSQVSRRTALVMIPTLVALILSRGEAAVALGAIAVASAYQLQFSREMETEADLMAVNALRRTPYDPLAMAGVMEVIQQADQLMPSTFPESLSSHPLVEVRRAALESVMGRPLSQVTWKPVPSPRWLRLNALSTGVAADPSKLLALWKERSPGLSAGERRLFGLMLLKAGYPKEAAQELQRARAEGQDDPLLQADLGDALFRTGDYQAARPFLEEARRSLPDYSYPFFHLAELELEAGHTPQAAVLYQRAMDGKPEIPEAYSRYGELLGGEGREGEASYYQGVAALLNGRFREGLDLLEEAKKTLGDKPYWRERIESRKAVFE